MAWVQLGSRKVNTALLCFMEQADEKATLHFQGGGASLELSPEESKALWRYLKSEDLMAAKDKGSAMVLPKRWSGGPDVAPAGAGGASSSGPGVPAAAQPAAALAPAKPSVPGATPQPSKPHVTVSTSGVSGMKTHSSSHSHSHSQHKPPQAVPKLAEAKKA